MTKLGRRPLPNPLTPEILADLREKGHTSYRRLHYHTGPGGSGIHDVCIQTFRKWVKQVDNGVPFKEDELISNLPTNSKPKRKPKPKGSNRLALDPDRVQQYINWGCDSVAELHEFMGPDGYAEVPFCEYAKFRSSFGKIKNELELPKHFRRNTYRGNKPNTNYNLYKDAIRKNPRANKSALAKILGISPQAISIYLSNHPELERLRISLKFKVEQEEKNLGDSRRTLLEKVRQNPQRLVDVLARSLYQKAYEKDPNAAKQALELAVEYETRTSSHWRNTAWYTLFGIYFDTLSAINKGLSGQDLPTQKKLGNKWGPNSQDSISYFLRRAGFAAREYVVDNNSNLWRAVKRAVKIGAGKKSIIHHLKIPLKKDALGYQLSRKGIRSSGSPFSIQGKTISPVDVSEIYELLDLAEKADEIAIAYSLGQKEVNILNEQREKYSGPITKKLQGIFMHPTWDKPYVTGELREHLAKVDAFYEARPTGEEPIFDLEGAIEYANIDPNLAKILDTQQAREQYEPDLNAV